MLIENPQGFKTFCAIFKIIFSNRVLIKVWATNCFQQNYFVFKVLKLKRDFSWMK
jgi:hypothetical protein